MDKEQKLRNLKIKFKLLRKTEKIIKFTLKRNIIIVKCRFTKNQSFKKIKTLKNRISFKIDVLTENVQIEKWRINKR